VTAQFPKPAKPAAKQVDPEPEAPEPTKPAAKKATKKSAKKAK